MNREDELLETLLADLLTHPPPGVSHADIEGWIRSHAAELSATVRRACANQPGHYYQVDGAWFVDNQFLQNLATQNETLPVRADWQVLLPEGALVCRSMRYRSLPGQVGLLYACEPDGELDLPAALSRWAKEHGLATLGGVWAQWPEEAPAQPSKKAGCGGCGVTCACTGCRAEHDHSEDHP
jgi:hypothetical protein